MCETLYCVRVLHLHRHGRGWRVTVSSQMIGAPQMIRGPVQLVTIARLVKALVGLCYFESITIKNGCFIFGHVVLRTQIFVLIFGTRTVKRRTY